MLDNETIEKIKKRALEITAVIDAKAGPYSCQIIPECSPHWHLIETYPNQEFKALEYLVDRHFGVFLPKFEDQASLKLDGMELCGGRRLIFPGHLFVFIWDIAAHWRRIYACPGVARVLMDTPEHPVVVPDAVIDFIQALQFGLSPRPMTKRRKGKIKYQQATEANQAEESVVLRCRSFWNEMVDLAAEERIGLFRRALGLEMLTPSGAEATVPS